MRILRLCIRSLLRLVRNDIYLTISSLIEVFLWVII